MRKLFLIFTLSIFGNLLFAQMNSNQNNSKTTFRLYSEAFDNYGSIPEIYTCQSKNISPPLKWEGIPNGTKSLILIVEDPDAPDPKSPKITWIHWILYNIPPTLISLEENIQSSKLPKGVLEGLNSWNKTGYGGPCPPIGKHRYFFRLYALNSILPNLHNPTKSELMEIAKDKIIGETFLVGLYQKH